MEDAATADRLCPLCLKSEIDKLRADLKYQTEEKECLQDKCDLIFAENDKLRTEVEQLKKLMLVYQYPDPVTGEMILTEKGVEACEERVHRKLSKDMEELRAQLAVARETLTRISTGWNIYEADDLSRLAQDSLSKLDDVQPTEMIK